MSIESQNNFTLEESASKVRIKLLSMHRIANSGHIGAGLSCIEILVYLYGRWLQPEDRFILSKGHGASALYATLHHFKKFTDPEIETYYRDGTLLPAHPAPRAFDEILAATGSLGHGFPIANGMAFAQLRLLKDSKSRVAVLVSDGECNEGSVWEAALFAGHHKLSNLTVVVDMNGLQGFGFTHEVLNMHPMREKWLSFGFEVIETDGHDFETLDQAFKLDSSRPRCILARTVKGKGVSFMENKMEWHYNPMTESEYLKAVEELQISRSSP